MKTPAAELTVNPLFGALMRPAMMGGVSFEFYGFNMMVSACAFIGLGNPLYGLVFIPLHVFGWLACRHDQALLTILYKRLMQLPSMPNESLWGVRAYDPY